MWLICLARGIAGADDQVVTDAFAGHPPELPLLAPDGTQAAIDIGEGVGESGSRSYVVAIMKPGGAIVDRYTVVDLALARRLVTPDGVTVPADKLAAAAKKIVKRVDKFTPFASRIDWDAIEAANGKLALGTSTLAFTSGTGLVLRWHGKTERIAARKRQFTDRDGGRCGGDPKLATVWWDASRDRVLMQVIFPGHDSCIDEPAVWLFW